MEARDRHADMSLLERFEKDVQEAGLTPPPRVFEQARVFSGSPKTHA